MDRAVLIPTGSTSNPSRAVVRTVVVAGDSTRQPTLTRSPADGRLTLAWAHPTYRPIITMSPELLEDFVAAHNELVLRRLADDRKDDL